MRERKLVYLISPALVAVTVGCVPSEPDASGPAAAVAATSLASTTASPFTILSIAAARPVVTTDGKQHLVYELVLQNTSATSAQITRIDVIDQERAGTVASYAADALAGILAVSPAGADPGAVAPGGTAAAFFDLALAPSDRPPRQLAHRIAVQQDGQATTIAGPTVAVIEQRTPSLGPPLHGDRLLDLNGCCDGGHRRALLTINGGLFLAQRFAIDFLRVDDHATFAGDPMNNASYFVFGAEVIATGSGRIVEAADGMPENVPPQPLPNVTIDTAAGNHIIEALDDGRFVLYAHLQNGSVRVQAGDLVRRGRVLALVGNTGNSTQPHLHFHVMDRPSPLISDGLPYVFEQFRLQGTVGVVDGVPSVIPTPPPQRRHNLLPMGLDVIAFP